MDNTQRESSTGETESKDSTTVAQDVTTRLSAIESKLRENDSQFNYYKTLIVKCVDASFRTERCERSCLWESHKAALALGTIESKLTIARQCLVKTVNRIAWLDRHDRRRSSDKRELERRILVGVVADTKKTINDLVEILLTSERSTIAETLKELTSIAESVNDEMARLFVVAKKLKQRRREIVDERDKLLAMTNEVEGRTG